MLGSQQTLKTEPDDACEVLSQRYLMTKPPNLTRSALRFQERLRRFADQAREAVQALPPGTQRELLEQEAPENEAAAKIDRWLSSPGLRRPG